MALAYVKESVQLNALFVDKSNNRVILQVPTNAMEVHNYFNTDFVNSVMRSTFGEKMATLPKFKVVIEQGYDLKK